MNTDNNNNNKNNNTNMSEKKKQQYTGRIYIVEHRVIKNVPVMAYSPEEAKELLEVMYDEMDEIQEYNETDHQCDREAADITCEGSDEIFFPAHEATE